MTIKEMEAENKRFCFWFFGIAIVVILLFTYLFVAYSYNKTGIQSEVFQKEVPIAVNENGFFFQVELLDKTFNQRLRCDREPTKKTALISYRIVEVKTVTGKYKMVPDVDGVASCKTLITS
jgi:hypothetical protein